MSSFGCKSKSTSFIDNDSQALSPQSCREEISLSPLEKALEHCNKVIKAHKENPEPLNDRALIYTLMNQIDLACKDSFKAFKIINNQKVKADPLVFHEIKVRHDSCMHRRNIEDKESR